MLKKKDKKVAKLERRKNESDARVEELKLEMAKMTRKYDKLKTTSEELRQPLLNCYNYCYSIFVNVVH